MAGAIGPVGDAVMPPRPGCLTWLSGRPAMPRAAAMALVFGLFAGAGQASADEADGAATWVVSGLSGTAFSRPGGASGDSWHRLRAGTPIEPGSVVRTDAGGRLTLANGEDRIELSGSSEIELPATPENGAFTRVIHWIGSAVFQVGKRPEPHFEVDTPYLVATVKGTEFTTSVSDAGASVEVDHGVVGVSTSDGKDSTDLAAGQSASVAAGDTGRVAPGKLSEQPAEAGGDKARQTVDTAAPDPGVPAAGPADAGGDGTAKNANGNAGQNGNGGGKGNGGGNGNAGGNGGGQGNGGGHGNAGGNGNGNGNGGGNGNGCHGNGGCHHDDDDDHDRHGRDRQQDRKS